ncbi:hypothetical protein ACJZ2D_001067 [Fusarium nematophilum]
MIKHNVSMVVGDRTACPLCGHEDAANAEHISEHLMNLSLLSLRYINDEVDFLSPDRLSSGADNDFESISDGSTEIHLGDRSDFTTSQLPPLDSSTEPEPVVEAASTDEIASPEPETISDVAKLPKSVASPETLVVQKAITLKNLRRSILASLSESQLDARPFFPRGSFEKIVTLQTVEAVLLSEHVAHEKELIQFVVEEAPIFFTILVSMRANIGPAIATLQRFGLIDNFLPIPKEVINDNCDEKETDRKCDHAPELDAFHHEPWEYDTLYTLYETQWRFLAPVFTDGHMHYRIAAEGVLPFTYLGRAHSTFFSTVREVEIHPDHQHLSQVRGKTSRMALKELRLSSDLAFESEMRKSHDIEAQSAAAISAFENDHILTLVASINRGRESFLLFPWAGGGNLRDFWTDDDTLPLTKDLMHNVLQQLHGLSTALFKLHDSNWRHGDLKPENILRFQNGTRLGNLKLGDLGLAKRHHDSTDFRDNPAETKYGSLRYEAPEAELMPHHPRSRLYDIWSIGCVFLEFIIWLRYGPDGLKKFNDGPANGDDSFKSFFSVSAEGEHNKEANVHHWVVLWLEDMCQDPDWPENTVLGDLVQLVQRDLLVVSLPSSEMAHQTTTRVDAESLMLRMSSMLDLAKETQTRHSYLLPESVQNRHERRRTPVDEDLSATMDRVVPPSRPLFVSSLDEYRAPLDSWDYVVDNDFAAKFLDSVADTLRRQGLALRRIPQFCEKCSPAGSKHPFQDTQLGFPELPETPEPVIFKPMKYWLETCDSCHQCMAAAPRSKLPKRLLDVGVVNRIRLCSTDGWNHDVRYIALSFIWGPGGVPTTLTSNLKNFEQEISPDDLTATFHHAINVARHLSITYLWIDALCIVQDELNVFQQDVLNLESVYSNAYCVIAASSSQAARDGFLTPRRRRVAVPVRTRSGDVISVCEHIDDFKKDVDDAPLGTRAWAFQERILARRTIFFTSTQVYWQCGEGIRTETLACLKNPAAELFGDPDFPQSAMQRIRIPHLIYQALYERYSRLQLSQAESRPLAIAALEARLSKAFGTLGAHGVFEKFLGRSLLWRRGSGEIFHRIKFEGSIAAPPSWSWMAHVGGINYFDVPVNSVDWHQIEWRREDSTSHATGRKRDVLVAQAWTYRDEDLSELFKDLPEDDDRQDRKCVIVGSGKTIEATTRPHYLLLVGRAADNAVWQRIGVGFADKEGLFADQSPELIEIF